MKEGDLVRFAKWNDVFPLNPKDWSKAPKPYIGTLIEHDKLMGSCRVLSNGELLKLRSVFVEKAGGKDIEGR